LNPHWDNLRIVAWSDLRVNNKSGYVKLVLKVCEIPSQKELVH